MFHIIIDMYVTFSHSQNVIRFLMRTYLCVDAFKNYFLGVPCVVVLTHSFFVRV